jgi:hypothetical protein
VDEEDLRALGRALTPRHPPPRRLGGHRERGEPRRVRRPVDRTVAVLALAPDEDVETLAAALTPDRFAGGTRRVTLSDSEYAAYDRFADRLAAAAMTGQFMGDRALFRSRYRPTEAGGDE